MNTPQFVSDCLAAARETDSARLVSDLVGKVIADPDAVFESLGSPEVGKIERIHVCDDLTVINVIWPPLMTILPHNHNMWAVIGVYCGREDYIFWRRTEEGTGRQVEAAGARSLGPGDVQMLGANAIHSVTNPVSEYTGAIHVYGGNFFEQERSEWDPQSLMEQPYDIERNVQRFENENAVAALRAKS